MSYTVTPYTAHNKNKAGFIDAGALSMHPDRDRDIVMQAIKILQPATQLQILKRVNNHGINTGKLVIILQDLLTDDLIKRSLNATIRGGAVGEFINKMEEALPANQQHDFTGSRYFYTLAVK